MQDNRKIKDIYTCKYIVDNKELYPLQRWYNKLIDKTIFELDVPDILRMLRQNIFVDIAVSKTIDYLREDPFAGEMYEGELLDKLSSVDSTELRKYKNEIREILSNGIKKNSDHEWIDIEEKKDFAEKIIKLSDRISDF